MKGLGLLGLALGLQGVVAFVRLRSNKDLKAKSVFDAYFKE